MKRLIYILSFYLLTMLFNGCKIADLRTFPVKELGITKVASEKGKAILKAAQKAQGMDRLNAFQVYEVQATDTWRGLAGGFANPWPEKAMSLQLKYQVNTFNGQATFLNGKQKGKTVGLQDWNYYEQESTGNTTFPKSNKKYNFILPALQYFLELPNRLLQAPIIVYGGGRTFNGQAYDLVLVSWETVEPNKNYDQYLAWINKETQLLEYCEYTIRDNTMKFPGVSSFHGSIHFSDYRNINGILIPFLHQVYLNEPKSKENKYLHQLTIQSFVLDQFNLNALYPNPELPPKPKSN